LSVEDDHSMQPDDTAMTCDIAQASANICDGITTPQYTKQ